VNENPGLLVIREDTFLKGEIRNCRQIEIYGYVEGELSANSLLVHEGGRFYGTARTDSADIHGTLQGEVRVKHLINIRSNGSVSGNVQYGQLAMEAGGNLSAEVHNVPPAIVGDLELTVDKGGSVRLTVQDLSAIDPDDKAKDLTFSVSRAKNGFVALTDAPARSVAKFTQFELEGGRVLFVHDGKATTAASFDVVATDKAGATSGIAQTVKVAVRPR
jgi:cytoskeletal protein CcmA (bactofilin family)